MFSGISTPTSLPTWGLSHHIPTAQHPDSLKTPLYLVWSCTSRNQVTFDRRACGIYHAEENNQHHSEHLRTAALQVLPWPIKHNMGHNQLKTRRQEHLKMIPTKSGLSLLLMLAATQTAHPPLHWNHHNVHPAQQHIPRESAGKQISTKHPISVPLDSLAILKEINVILSYSLL